MLLKDQRWKEDSNRFDMGHGNEQPSEDVSPKVVDLDEENGKEHPNNFRKLISE